MSPATRKRPTVDLDAIVQRCEALKLLHAAQAPWTRTGSAEGTELLYATGPSNEHAVGMRLRGARVFSLATPAWWESDVQGSTQVIGKLMNQEDSGSSVNSRI